MGGTSFIPTVADGRFNAAPTDAGAPMRTARYQLAILIRLTAAACVCALISSGARPDDQPDGAVSPLRKSLKERWRVEYLTKQRPPNRGRRWITLDEDGQISGSIRPAKKLSDQEREGLLGLAVSALEAFSFEPRMGSVVDSPEMSLSLSSGPRRIKIQIVEFDGETNQEPRTLLKHFETLADGRDPGPPPARGKGKRLSAIGGRSSVKVEIDGRSQPLALNPFKNRDLAVKAVRDFTFATVAGVDEGTTSVSLSITSPSLEGFRRIEICEERLASEAVRKSFVSELVESGKE
jgi:hypothetical protein